ncbi:hypothetical protein [Bacillus sp. Marseille-P3661]|uniref:hypothetical protein n=1 Tax=Bacillus sp. Marseille-P3661 TaxID=1936234 RepID=UPI000C82347A|nr:hypothetical protein [Bacillus sp. Marseille-P3661]
MEVRLIRISPILNGEFSSISSINENEVKNLSQYSIVFLILFTIVMAIGLVYTIRLGQTQGQKQRSDYDSDINDVVEAHPYTRNPVFWVYIGGFGLILLYIVYYML